MRSRVQRASGIPCALCFLGAQEFQQTSDAMRRENANAYSAVIARFNRATQYSRDADDRIEKPRRTGSPRFRGGRQVIARPHYLTISQKIPASATKAMVNKHGTKVGKPGPVDHGMRQRQPEEARRPERRHRIGLSGQMRCDHEGGERREHLDRVQIGAVRALAPGRDRAQQAGINIIRWLERSVGPDLADDIGNPHAAVSMAV